MSSKAADKTTVTNAMLQLWMLQITSETHPHSWGSDHFSNATCEHAYSKHTGHWTFLVAYIQVNQTSM